MSEEYKIVFVPDKGRAIIDIKTKRVYYDEFEIIKELQDRIDKAIDYIKREISLIDKDLIECELTYDEKQYFEITRNKYVSVLEILGGKE